MGCIWNLKSGKALVLAFASLMALLAPLGNHAGATSSGQVAQGQDSLPAPADGAAYFGVHASTEPVLAYTENAASVAIDEGLKLSGSIEQQHERPGRADTRQYGRLESASNWYAGCDGSALRSSSRNPGCCRCDSVNICGGCTTCSR